MRENDALGPETVQRPPTMPGGEIEQTPARAGPTGSEPLPCRPALACQTVFHCLSVAVVDDMPAYKHTQAGYMTAGTLRFYFAPGFWERRIPLNDVQRATSVRTSPIHGWGIHYTPRGWLYNVLGLDAVEIETSSETLRLGTDEPERLQQAIEQAQSGPLASS